MKLNDGIEVLRFSTEKVLKSMENCLLRMCGNHAFSDSTVGHTHLCA